jgi:spermidine synthase
LNLSGWRLVDELNGFIVVKRGSIVQMRSGPSSVYTTYNRSRLLTHSYWDYLSASAASVEKARILMIGLGGGTVVIQASRLASPASIDAVEIDAGVVELARRHFLTGTRCNVTVGDGSEFIKGKKSEYDIIILDAFVGLSVPPAFLEKAFVGHVFDALGTTGLFVINMIDPAQKNAYIAKLKERFEVYSIHPLPLENTIFICAKGLPKEEIVKGIRARLGGNGDAAFLIDAYENMRHL